MLLKKQRQLSRVRKTDGGEKICADGQAPLSARELPAMCHVGGQPAGVGSIHIMPEKVDSYDSVTSQNFFRQFLREVAGVRKYFPKIAVARQYVDLKVLLVKVGKDVKCQCITGMSKVHGDIPARQIVEQSHAVGFQANSRSLVSAAKSVLRMMGQPDIRHPAHLPEDGFQELKPLFQ